MFTFNSMLGLLSRRKSLLQGLSFLAATPMWGIRPIRRTLLLHIHDMPGLTGSFHDISAGIWRDMGDTGDIARYNEILARF